MFVTEIVEDVFEIGVDVNKIVVDVFYTVDVYKIVGVFAIVKL